MIHATNLSKRFFSQHILNRVSFSVPRGSSYVVLGQSGVGKSVLLKILAGLMVPDEGKVEIDTTNVGMLFQKNALFDSLTVIENLEFPLRERTHLSASQRRDKSLKFLEWVGLTGTDHLFPDELSGGMQKRLGIARALIVEPEVLFYDEPTAGLDPITSRVIVELILRLRAEFKTTLVSVTSDVLRAYQLADHIGLLVRGPDGAHLIDAGTPAQARESKDPAVQQFLKGSTQGPLTAHDDRLAVKFIDPFEQCAATLTERFDVDYF